VYICVLFVCRSTVCLSGCPLWRNKVQTYCLYPVNGLRKLSVPYRRLKPASACKSSGVKRVPIHALRSLSTFSQIIKMAGRHWPCSPPSSAGINYCGLGTRRQNLEGDTNANCLLSFPIYSYLLTLRSLTSLSYRSTSRP